MRAYMTNGSIDFLQKLIDKNPDIEFKLMQNRDGGLAYYEHSQKEIFQSGRKYEIVEKTGELQETGYVVMNNIPVVEESQDLFEDRFKKRKGSVEKMPGFYAFRLLRPIKEKHYIVLTQWQSEKYFEHWKESDVFSEAHQKQAVKSSVYFFQNSFVNTYTMYEEDEEESNASNQAEE